MVASINASLSSGIVTTADNSGYLQLQTGNTAALTIDTSQNVGIGTASPSYKLDIVGDIRLQGTDKKLYFDTTGSSASNYVGITNTYYTTLYCGRGSTAQLDLTNSATILFSTSSLERMRIDSVGDVGIGTTDPLTKLHINQNTTTPTAAPSATNLFITGADASNNYTVLDGYGSASGYIGRRAQGTLASPTAVVAGNALGQIGGRGYGTTGFSTANKAQIVLYAAETWTDSAQGTYLSFHTTANGGTTMTEKMVLDNAGNVGIGTTSPSAGYKVDVANSGDIKFLVRSTTNATTGNSAYTLQSASGADWLLQTGYDMSNAIRFYDQTAGAERMRIDSSGNVGIGTSSPSTYGALTVRKYITSGSQNYAASFSDTINATLGIGFTSGFANFVSDAGQAFYTSSTERMRIDSSGYVQGTVNGLSAGRMLAYQYYRLNAGYAGSNATGAQSLFGVGVTLVGSTVYEFEISVGLVKTAGTTAHTISLVFGGTATLNNIGYSVIGDINATGTAGVSNLVVYYYTTAAASQATLSAATASVTSTIIAKGTVSVNAGGTFIPQYSLSAAPGGAYTTAIGSYVKIAPLGASGANTNIGSWA
jgi:hypothetical protein